MEFVSKSSRKYREVVPPFVENLKLNVPNLIMWVGSDSYGLAKAGYDFGFNAIWFTNKKDVISLLSVKALVLCNAVVNLDVLSAMNFATEHGICLIWIHAYRHPPPRQIWNFNHCIIYRPKIFLFWEAMHQWVK